MLTWWHHKDPMIPAKAKASIFTASSSRSVPSKWLSAVQSVLDRQTSYKTHPSRLLGLGQLYYQLSFIISCQQPCLSLCVCIILFLSAVVFLAALSPAFWPIFVFWQNCLSVTAAGAGGGGRCWDCGGRVDAGQLFAIGIKNRVNIT